MRALVGVMTLVVLAVLAPVGRAAVVQVPSSIPSDCSKPVERELNRFLAEVPNNSTVRFAKGCYGQDRSIWIRNRRGLTLDGNGATFKIITKDRNTEYFRSNVRVRGGSSITLKDVTVLGACKPRQCRNGSPPPPKDGYGQHGINLESTARPTLDNVHVRDVLSDGVSAQGTLDPKVGWRGRPTSNMTIRDSHIERAGRQLIAITNLDGGVIQNSRIENGPQTGIDLEVDVRGFVARRVKIIGNTFNNIHANTIANGGIGSDPHVGDIEILNNTMPRQATNCAEGNIYLRTPGPTDPQVYRSGYTIKGNRFRNISTFVEAEWIKDLTIENNSTRLQKSGCGEKAAVVLKDSEAKLAGNNFTGFPAAVRKISTKKDGSGEESSLPPIWVWIVVGLALVALLLALVRVKRKPAST